jgi:hypothetical protein
LRRRGREIDAQVCGADRVGFVGDLLPAHIEARGAPEVSATSRPYSPKTAPSTIPRPDLDSSRSFTILESDTASNLEADQHGDAEPGGKQHGGDRIVHISGS